MVLRRLLFEAARRLAENPEVRRKAADTVETAYRKAAPKVENAGRHVAETLKETAAEGSALDDPVGFARRFGKRLLPPER